jgi:hypothetical protein
MSDRREQTERVHDTASVLMTTLDMLANDFDSMNSAEIRELVWLAKYENDHLMGATLRPNGIGRRIVLAERW